MPSSEWAATEIRGEKQCDQLHCLYTSHLTTESASSHKGQDCQKEEPSANYLHIRIFVWLVGWFRDGTKG